MWYKSFRNQNGISCLEKHNEVILLSVYKKIYHEGSCTKNTYDLHRIQNKEALSSFC